MNTAADAVTSIRLFPFPSYGKHHKISVTAQAHTIGDQPPYFSVTAEIFKPGKSDCDACGCLHKEALRVWPAIAPIVALHLSDAETGEPMHAEANGFYWLEGAAGGFGSEYHGASGSGGKSPDECLRIFAEHCRIGLDEASGYVRAVKDAHRDSSRMGRPASLAAAKTDWKTICNDMRPRWKLEAEAGMELLRSLDPQF